MKLNVDFIYPIGSIYMSVNSVSPATLFGGTWEQIKGRFLIGVGSNEANSTSYWGDISTGDVNCTAGETGGEAWHTLSINEMPSHYHRKYTITCGQEASGYGLTNNSQGFEGRVIVSSSNSGNATDSRGGSQKHNNMPPYLAVYMWKRTA